MNKPFKLLLIDDDEPILANLCIFLRDKKYDVTSASDGLEGLKLFENDQQGFDLIITRYRYAKNKRNGPYFNN